MDTIDTFLNAMFAPYPATPRLQEAKAELRAMMEDAYADAIASGHTHNEAVGQVITDFGNLDELAEALGIAGDLRAGSQAGSATADVGSAAVGSAAVGSAAVGAGDTASPGSAASQHTSPAPEQALAPREQVNAAPAAGFASEGFTAEGFATAGFATSAFAAAGTPDDFGSERPSRRQQLVRHMHRLYRTWRAEPSIDEVFIVLAGVVWWLTSLAIYLVFVALQVWVTAWIIWPLSGVLFKAFISARFNWRETFIYQAGVIWWYACLVVLFASVFFIPTSWYTSWTIWLISGVLLGALAGMRSWRAHLRSRVLQ